MSKEKQKRDRRKKLAKQLQAALFANGCSRCDERRHEQLDIHHTNPDTKEHGFAELIGRGQLGRLRKELAKGYEVVCKKCHARI